MLKKKQSLFSLLLAGCAAGLLLLLLIPPPKTYLLHDLGSLDRVITQSLAAYGIPAGRLQVQTSRVDSLLTRRDYTVQVPLRFPATRVHIAIAQGAHPYGVKVLGSYNRDETALRLTLSYGPTLLRTVEMQFSEPHEPQPLP
ncbi:MAG: hypothetical protein LAT75_03595 [Candidatus Cyclonatronum sp.]|uniref:hypothetical protein n=1 Tax=Cyclonatronum sp. TaxID=3024185 RepID=UPI0025C70210|nr:hypothetical protein [Cyclonatronum sp.]MCH8485921.1 hypothetical protein [Cyclonatronum sp.]